MKYLLCLKLFEILILEPRWICGLRFIVFLCSFIILCFGTSFKQLRIAHLTIISKYSQSDISRCISDNVVNIRQHKVPNYIYPRRKKIPLFMLYMAFYVSCWAYISPRSLLIWLNAMCCFFILPLFRYTLFGKHQFFKELLWKYFLACLICFLCAKVIFC